MGMRQKKASSEIVRDLNQPCTSSTVRDALNSNPMAEFLKLQLWPPLTKKHKLARLEFAKKYFL